MGKSIKRTAMATIAAIFWVALAYGIYMTVISL
ncbi:MAG: hypothetical protein ACI84R_002753 [Candidatus Azotimanducaceae bacterium]|jgi:hypothetical protein